MIGQTLGRYRLVERLGEGGVVFRAEDPRLELDVALKVLKQDALHDEDSKRRFRFEARALSRLLHPTSRRSLISTPTKASTSWCSSSCPANRWLARSRTARSPRPGRAPSHSMSSKPSSRRTSGARPSRPEAREHVITPRGARQRAVTVRGAYRKRGLTPVFSRVARGLTPCSGRNSLAPRTAVAAPPTTRSPRTMSARSTRLAAAARWASAILPRAAGRGSHRSPKRDRVVNASNLGLELTPILTAAEAAEQCTSCALVPGMSRFSTPARAG